MEPIKHIKKEKKHLKRLKEMHGAIYTKVAPLEVGFHPSKEPIAPGSQYSLNYSPIKKLQPWAKVYGCAWFHLLGEIPESAHGKHVVVHINIGGEGVAYQGSEPTQGITLVMSYIDRLQSGVGKSILEVSPAAKAGDKVEFYIDGGYNGYYNYPFGMGIFQYANLSVVNDELLDFYYDYFCITSLLSVTKGNDKRFTLEKNLDESFKAAQTMPVNGRSILVPLLKGRPEPGLNITAVGHSHLDLAWLWPERETKRKAQRTFANQINNGLRYPEYIYGASQPWQFEYIKSNYPKQYEALKSMAAKGQLELQGGMWVEADTNIPSGEALIRQIYYGKTFFQEEFNQDMKICWLPDVFGYSGNLPQILKKSGLAYFLTIKLSWNEHNRFPYRSFVWQGIDGSEVLVHMPPDETYNSAGSPACTRHITDNYTEKDLAPEALMLYGIGDGGGGPGEAHIELVSRQGSLEGSPQVLPGTAIDFFEKLNNHKTKLPVYQGELYLEKHQGTYTTQAANKKYNRLCEYALQDLETLSTLAWYQGYSYPKGKLDAWWKEALFYQFHDIIPGSSIKRVYDESCSRYKIILEEINQQKKEVLDFLCNKKDQVDGGYGEHGVYFNSTAFIRREYLKEKNQWKAVNIAPYSFAVGEDLEEDGASWVQAGEKTIENSHLKITFAPDGSISSALLKEEGFEFAKDNLNVFRLYKDKWLYYNAWDIDWKYHQKPNIILKAHKQESFVDGPKVVWRNHYKHGRTTIVQDVVLYANCPVVYFDTHVDMHETFKMLRADFDVNLYSKEVLCDIQMGSIRRSTGDTTNEEKAQFEICAHKYVALTDKGHSAALINNGKYGHRVKGNRISLNLLRTPVYPDRKADRGKHHFIYGLHLHKGETDVETLAYSYALNKPLIKVDEIKKTVIKSTGIKITGTAQNRPIVQTTNPNVVVETIKVAWEEDGVILRLFESQGKRAVCKLETIFKVTKAFETDLMERKPKEITLDALVFTPYEIKTIKLEVVRARKA